jgi:hypothetical protein
MLQRKRRRRLAGFLTGMLLAVVLMLFTAGGLFAQAGVARCVAPPLPADKAERWAEDMALATTQFREAGVVLDLVPLEDAP